MLSYDSGIKNFVLGRYRMKMLVCLLICAGLAAMVPSQLTFEPLGITERGTHVELEISSVTQGKARGSQIKKCALRLNGSEFDNGDPQKINDGLSSKQWYKNKEGLECTTVTVKKGYHFTIKGAHWSDGTYEEFSKVIDMDGTKKKVSKEICEGD